jgi:lipoate-protein ligase A
MTVLQLPGSLELLERAERGTALARFIAVDRPTVLLGRRQETSVLNPGLVDRSGWDVLQRITPGGLVYMDPEAICLELALPASHPDFTPDVVAATRWFGRLFVGALGEMGVEAELAPTNSAIPNGPAAQACFASWVRGEVLLQGRKAFGTAQYRRRDGALFQGVGLTEGSHGRVVSVLTDNAGERTRAVAAIDRMSRPVGGVQCEDLARAIRKQVERTGIGF